MKKIILFALLVMILTSCVESFCPSYGGTKRMTKHGDKAQAKYARHARKNI